MTLTRSDLRPLSVGVHSFQSRSFARWSGMVAAATISVIPVVVVFLFLQRYLAERIAAASDSTRAPGITRTVASGTFRWLTPGR